jgi:hypothetical protein
MPEGFLPATKSSAFSREVKDLTVYCPEVSTQTSGSDPVDTLTLCAFEMCDILLTVIPTHVHPRDMTRPYSVEFCGHVAELALSGRH